MQVAKRMASITPFYVMELLRRAKQLEAEGKEIIHMEIGEPDYGTPEPIIESGLAYIKKGQVKYTPAAGLPALRQKISRFYQDQYQVNVPMERIFITPGASGAFLLALGVSLDPGTDILLADPSYPCNQNFIQLFSGTAKYVPVGADTAYQLSVDLVRRHWQAKTGGVLIASPSNPTGSLISRLQLEKIIQFIDTQQGILFSDEIYHGLVYEPGIASALQLSEQVFVMNSFSKYFGMTGWRIGWLVVPPQFIEATEKLAQNIFISTSSHSQYAALAAFDAETLLELENRRLDFKQKRDFLHTNLVRLGFKIPIKPAGAFYIYADCSQFTYDSFQFAEQLLEVEGVAVTPGKDFGSNNSHHYLRFAYTSSLQEIAKAIQRLERFIKNL